MTWRVFPAGELGLALEKGEVDAVADSEPIGTLLLAKARFAMSPTRLRTPLIRTNTAAPWW